MTIGIYKLAFNGTDKLYFGQSIDINRRYLDHVFKMKQGIASKKLQEAYNTYGTPLLEIMESCSLELLDIREKYFISLFSSVEKGLNSTSGGHSNFGSEHSASKYSKETYLEILFYLTNTNLSVIDIASITETTKSTVMHISSLSRHSWLEEADPENYNKLAVLRAMGNKRCAISQGKIYPLIVSPEGIKYSVTNTRRFSEEHGISNGNLCSVLNGVQKYAKGWHLESTPAIPKPIKVISIEGNIVEIPYRGVPEFCRKFNLTETSVRDILNGKQKTHKGWKLYHA